MDGILFARCFRDDDDLLKWKQEDVGNFHKCLRNARQATSLFIAVLYFVRPSKKSKRNPSAFDQRTDHLRLFLCPNICNAPCPHQTTLTLNSVDPSAFLQHFLQSQKVPTTKHPTHPRTRRRKQPSFIADGLK